MPLTTGLSSHWRLNEASGTRVDAHGSNDLSPTDTPGSVTGKIGDAVSLNGSSQFLSVVSDTSLDNGTGSFTIACWVKLTASGATQSVVAKEDGSNNNSDYHLFLNFLDDIAFQVYDGASSTFINGGVALSTGVWYFIVVWYDDDAQTLNVQVDDGTPASSSYTSGVVAGTADFRIGNDSGSNFFGGAIDSVSYWKRVLTSGERTSLYAAGAGLDYPFTPPAMEIVSVLEGVAGTVLRMSYDFSLGSVLQMKSGMLSVMTQGGNVPISGALHGVAGMKALASYERLGSTTLRGIAGMRNKLSYEHTMLDRMRGVAGILARGALAFSSGIPLYIAGIDTTSNTLPLFISGPLTTPLSDSISLTMFANTAGTSGVFKELPLWMDGTNEIYNSINLFLQGPEFASLTQQLTLYIAGAYYNISGNIPLFLQNTGISSNIPLFIQGTGPSGIGGETPGALPLMASLNLYLERPASNWIPLTIFGPGVDASGSIPLYMQGAYLLSGDIPLVIPEVIGVMNSSIKLYTHGF